MKYVRFEGPAGKGFWSDKSVRDNLPAEVESKFWTAGNRHCPPPWDLMETWEGKAKFWFKAEPGNRALAAADEGFALLPEDQTILVRRESADPGRIVWQDEHQVLVADPGVVVEKRGAQFPFAEEVAVRGRLWGTAPVNQIVNAGDEMILTYNLRREDP